MEGVLWWMDGWMDGWWRDQTVYTCQELETRATCSNLNNGFYWLEYIDWLQIYSFLKLPLPPLLPSLPPSCFLSVIPVFISAVPCSQSASSWWAYWQPHHSTLLSYWDVFAAFPVLYRSTPCSCPRTSVCVLVGVIGVIVIDWLYCGYIFFFFFYSIDCIFFSAPPPRAWEVQRGCSRLRPETLCSRPGRPWSSRTLSCWTSAPKCSCTGCCGRDPSDGRRQSGPAGEDLVWFTCFWSFFFKPLCNLVTSEPPGWP